MVFCVCENNNTDMLYQACLNTDNKKEFALLQNELYVPELNMFTVYDTNVKDGVVSVNCYMLSENDYINRTAAQFAISAKQSIEYSYLTTLLKPYKTVATDCIVTEVKNTIKYMMFRLLERYKNKCKKA